MIAVCGFEVIARVYVLQRIVSVLDMFANDACLAILLGTGDKAAKASRTLDYLAAVADNVSAQELGACSLLAAQVSGSLEVIHSSSSGYRIVSADAAAAHLLVDVRSSPFESLATGDGEVERVRQFLDAAQSDSLPASILHTTLRGSSVS